LTEREISLAAGGSRGAKRSTDAKISSAHDSNTLKQAIKKTNAAWQYEVEAVLIGRELDAIHHPTIGKGGEMSPCSLVCWHTAAQ
jgi:hypothetical protein